MSRRGWWAWCALLAAALLTTGATAAETTVRFSLDFKFEGPSAPFLLALDKGYYKTEGLDVTIDPNRRLARTDRARRHPAHYDMGLADINSLIKFRDAKPGAPLKAVFMLYNRPPFAVIGRKSRGIGSPEGSGRQNAWRAGNRLALCAVADFRAGERHRCCPR